MLQCDLSWEYSSEPLVTGFRAFQAWSFDYITFENTLVTLVPPAGQVGQVSLRYVNTELATFAGCEWFGDLAPQSPVTPFANVRFVDGRDRTRNGTFATSNGNAVLASRKVEGLPRGAFSGVAAGESEPLPGMPPLETRLGVRYHDTSPSQRWSLEFASRIVNSQDRVATSLLESRTGGFSIFDLRAIFRPSRSDRWIVSTGVENMFDRLYREHLDFRTQSGLSIYQPGANFYLGTSITY